MFDVKTPLSKLHRATRRITVGSFVAVPGVWAAVNASGNLINIATNLTSGAQPKVLKPVLGNASTNVYESNDIKVGSIATIESPFRASVDGVGYQKVDAQSSTINNVTNYPQGADLSVAFRLAPSTEAGATYCLAADLGKLRPAFTGDVVVARVESLDATNGILTYETVTPHIK